MRFAKLGQPAWQVAIALDALFEYLYMARAIHRLDCVLPAVNRLGGVHGIAKRSPVTGGLPERPVHELRRIDLVVAGCILLLAHEFDQALKQGPALRVPEHRAGRLFLEVASAAR